MIYSRLTNTLPDGVIFLPGFELHYPPSLCELFFFPHEIDIAIDLTLSSPSNISTICTKSNLQLVYFLTFRELNLGH